MELDTMGCQRGCSALADGTHEHDFLMARPDVSLNLICLIFQVS